ncbi:multidrug effflux MFS transporter [Bacteroides congonensis]
MTVIINKENSKVFLLILLGMLSAFGPFVTDMYLPSLPAMADYFSASLPMVQMGLTTSMIGLALGQVFFGPLSDNYGRRPLLLASMVLFVISTVFCLFSPDIYSFVILRLIQGVAGAGGIVISRSVATDKFSGKELAKMLAVIGAINGIAPVAAPVIGGLVTGIVGWKGIFVILLFIGVVLGIACIRFKESLPAEKRSKAGIISTFRSFGVIIHNRRYMLYVLQLAFAQGILFAYIASSPFIVQQHYGFSPFAFSICFAVNAVAIGMAAAISVKFRRTENGTLTGCIGMLVLSVCVMVALYSGCGFWTYELLMFVLLFMMGLTFTSSTTLAMDCERRYAGAASALLGALCFASGGIVSPLVGLGNILISTGVIFVVCAVCSLLCALWAIRRATLKVAAYGI